MDTGRQQRGAVIAQTGQVKFEGRSWRVGSQSRPDKKYRVNPHADSCTCPDHEETNERCKHVWAVIFTMSEQLTFADGSTKKVTYAQQWSVYNRAQVEEKDTFMRLLADLCSTVAQPPQTNGRPRLPLADMTFAAAFKVYSRFSSRRFSSDLREAHERGLIKRVPHFNSVTGYLSKETLTPILYDLITESSLPLKAVESDFAVDSSGFTATRYARWLNEKHGVSTPYRQREWIKAHLMVGTRTNIVTSIEVTDFKGGDTT